VLTPNEQEQERLEQERVRLLSDGLLLDNAVAFVECFEDWARISDAQLNGLLNFSRAGLDELQKFVKHQADRDWEKSEEGGSAEGGTGDRHRSKAQVHQEFYKKLTTQLTQIRSLAKDEAIIPPGATSAQEKKHLSEMGAALAAEFVQHLVAEMLYRKALERRPRPGVTEG
jgi:hypothetical protein